VVADDAEAATLPVGDAADGDTNDAEPVVEPIEEPKDEQSADPKEEPQDLPDSDDEFCKAAEEVQAALDEFSSGGVPTPEQVESRLNNARQKMAIAVDLAPADMMDAVVTSAAGFERLAAEFEKVGYDILDADIAAMEAIDATPEYEEANDRVTLYLFEKCGVGEDPALMEDFDDAVDEVLPEERTIRDQIVAILVPLGFTPEEADCLSRQEELVDALSATDEEVFALFARCGVPEERVAPLLSLDF
ncbi:MAG: hypothetical protein HKN01_07735, partial [Acidimicrobiia bacterium]|nr:hypothetical protein [Acidimicrobiia bacterium]